MSTFFVETVDAKFDNCFYQQEDDNSTTCLRDEDYGKEKEDDWQEEEIGLEEHFWDGFFFPSVFAVFYEE